MNRTYTMGADEQSSSLLLLDSRMAQNQNKATSDSSGCPVLRTQSRDDDVASHAVERGSPA
jgi:hypothetical protein